jgi:hypothetical protein
MLFDIMFKEYVNTKLNNYKQHNYVSLFADTHYL